VPLAIYKSKEDKEEDVVTMTSKSLKDKLDGEQFVYQRLAPTPLLWKEKGIHPMSHFGLFHKFQSEFMDMHHG
jgi:hypothetical protein